MVNSHAFKKQTVIITQIKLKTEETFDKLDDKENS